MLINYSTTDLNVFLSKAEQKLVILGDVLVQQVNWDEVEDSLLDKIELLSFILDEIDRTVDQDQIDKLVYFALDYFNLHEIPYSPFSIMPTTIVSTGGSGGSSDWNDITNKPTTFLPSPHTHVDNEVNISISGITEFLDRFSTSFTGNLEDFIKTLMIKYTNPLFTSFTQDKGTSFELGQYIMGTVAFAWNISTPANVKNSANSGSITVSETDPFVSNLPFNLFGTTGTTRLLTVPYRKVIPGTLSFYMNGVNSNNLSMNTPSVSLTWYSRIWFGNSVDPTQTVSEIEAFAGVLTNNRNVTVNISGSGYKYIFIPDNIDQTGISFYDPINAFSVDMEAPVAETITNTFGVSMPGQIYRTVNSLGSSLTINIL